MQLENTIHIHAPINVVWDVTVDVETWPEFSPTFQSIKRLDRGPFDVGSAALIKQPSAPETRWEVTAMEAGQSFTWECRSGGIYTRATHELAAEGDVVVSVLRVEMTGAAAWLLTPVLRPLVRRALQKENAGLKARCESLAASGVATAG